MLSPKIKVASLERGDALDTLAEFMRQAPNERIRGRASDLAADITSGTSLSWAKVRRLAVYEFWLEQQARARLKPRFNPDADVLEPARAVPEPAPVPATSPSPAPAETPTLPSRHLLLSPDLQAQVIGMIGDILGTLTLKWTKRRKLSRLREGLEHNPRLHYRDLTWIEQLHISARKRR